MTIVRTVSSPSRRLSPTTNHQQPTTNHQQPTTNTSLHRHALREVARLVDVAAAHHGNVIRQELQRHHGKQRRQELLHARNADDVLAEIVERSEEHTSELQSRGQLVCRLLLEKKNLSQT